MRHVVVAGVGMIPFVKPGASEPYDRMGAQATQLALADAGLGYAQMQQAYVGYVYGDSTCGQRVVYEVGAFQGILTLFFSMDKMVGKDFEAGLARLKALARWRWRA